MNKHLTDGELRLALDGELDSPSQKHLAVCETCRARQSTVRTQAEAVGHKLAFLAAPSTDASPAVQTSLKRFEAQKVSRKETPVFKRIFASTAVRAAAIAIVVFALIISIPGARALADEVLSLFRIEQVTVLPVDFTGLEQLTGNGALGKQLSALISDSTMMTLKPGDPVQVTDAAEASQKTGFTVRLPQDATPSRLSVMNKAAFTFTVDRAKAQALLDEAGRSDLVLPQEIDGAAIDVNVPASAIADFNACPDPATSDSPVGPSASSEYPDCIVLAEMPSPTVDAPPSVDVAQLAQIGLEFTGMTAEQAAAFTQTVDWTSTLVVPIPKNAATYEQVTVDGVSGYLIQRPSNDAPQYVVLWIKDGILYSIGGLGANSAQAIEMADSLP
jgi:predicted anti-sigma-YlaC factor YlaD